MNDDYLWDRSGEPDPEVERLERVLGKYRYQPRQLSPALVSRLSHGRTGWTRLAAIAAAILMVLAGLWIFKVQKTAVIDPPVLSSNDDRPTKTPDKPRELVPPTVAPAKEPAHLPAVATTPKSPRKPYRRTPEERFEARAPHVDSGSIAERQPLINPFIDVETARHIERAQLLLRSFRNTGDSGSPRGADLSYERRGSRELLYKNVLLRRDAEAKGNMPVEDLLGGLEPFLLDIANLPDRPSSNDVRSIKERMQKKEIIAALQIYSAPTLSQVF